jgi:tetratricopeptide (TPR) repeat protein
LTGLFAIPQHWEALRAGRDAWLAPGAALVLVNGLLTLLNVVPIPGASDVSSVRNDLTQILRLPWLKPGALAAMTKAAPAAKLARLRVLGDYRAAVEEGQKQLALEPSNWIVRAEIATLLLLSRRYAEAAAEYRVFVDADLPAKDEMPPLVVAMMANNYAWACYMQDEPEALTAADRASERAIAAAPNNPYILGTRGAVLVETARLAEGRKLLTRAIRLHGDRHSRASLFASLALAAAREGRPSEAQRLLQKARRMDRECNLLTRVERELSRS